MTPDLFTAKNIIIQGITGSHGRFQTKQMLAAGTQIIAGTSPNKAGELVEGVPVYNTIKAIQQDYSVDITVIFVPAPFAKSAIFEAINAHIPLIICITEGIPIHDMLQIKHKLIGSSSTLIGPNSPGVIIPGVNKLGIIPENISLPGHTAIVSRSGTLTYEVIAGLSARGIGQRYVIGIGGDSIKGINFVECLELFEHDPFITQIVMIGEIGGIDELTAARYIKKSVTKPVYAYIAGRHAPAGIQLGHAGAILANINESADTKNRILTESGVLVASNISTLISMVATHQETIT